MHLPSPSVEDTETMRCINGHDLRAGEEQRCPTCGEPAASLVSSVRREGLKYILPGIGLLVGPFVIAGMIGRSGGAGDAKWFLTLVFLFFVIGGAIMTFGALNSLLRARRIVKNRIGQSAEPQSLLKFPCPQCSTLNEGPFQNPAPACVSCGTRVLGVVCWRCGDIQAQRGFENDAPREIYECASCGQEQPMPASENVVPWWR